MSIQAVWVISLPSPASRLVQQREGRLLFSRFYPTYIKKSKQIEEEQHVPLPSNPDFIKSILFELGHTQEGSSKFITARDSCKREEQKPVFEIATTLGKLWPLVVLEQRGILFCSLPFVEQGAHSRPPLIEMPGVTQAFLLLSSMAEYFRQIQGSEGAQDIVRDLYAFLTHAAPFGCVVDVSVDSIIAKMSNKPSAIPRSQKQPAWKPVLYKGKNQIFISITEYIRAVQYDKDNLADTWDLYGTVLCKAELEGALTDVTLTVAQVTDGDVTPLDHLLVHACVQSADSEILSDGKERAIPRRVRFTPPLEMIPLCHYTVSRLKKLPITGTFEMFTEERTTKINIRLKLSETMKNAFEYCELQVPLINRSPLSILETSQNHGNVMISPDRSVLVWNIGQKFPPKTLEVTMSAVLGTSETRQTGSLEDQFCVGQNAYAQLYFKVPDFTLSGCFVDPKSIQVSPTMKYKLTTVREFQSMEYKLWNVHGDALVSSLPRGLQEYVDNR